MKKVQLKRTLNNNYNSYNDLSDEELMFLTQKEDISAYSFLVKKYQKKIMNFFYHLGVNSECEDLAQLTFIKIFHYRKRWKRKASFQTFLYLVARRIWLDYLRKQKKEKKAKDILTDAYSMKRTIHSSGDIKAKIFEILQELPEGSKNALIMAFLDGLKYKEIAEILNCAEGTIKSRIFFALEYIRKRLKNEN